MRKKLTVLGVFILLFIVVEIFLRKGFGFGNNVLVREDPDFEYIAQPNQERNRFGNKIYYNEISMRSEAIQPNSRKILGLGDSVLNGGSLIDQRALATSMLNEKLTNQTGKDLQVLNISYKGWGPDNAVAYLNKFGVFDAELIFLLVSSHDAYDNMDFTKVVETDKNLPGKQYPLAILEVIDAYLLPRLPNFGGGGEKNTERTSKDQKFNTGFQDLLDLSCEKNIPLIIYLHPEIYEIEKGEYHEEGNLIIDFAMEKNITLIKGIEGAKVEHYRDYIHINEDGQKHISKGLFPVLSRFISLKD